MATKYPFDRIIILHNPQSKNAKTANTRIKHLQKRYKGQVKTIEISDELAVTRQLLLNVLSEEVATGKTPVLCIAGGDGTVNMALQSLTSPAVPDYVHDIPIVPMGTGNANDLAYMLYDDPTHIDDIFEQGVPITIRPLECTITVPRSIPERRVAASYISFGAMAYGAHELNRPEVRNHAHLAKWYGAFVPDFLAVRAAVQAPTFAIRYEGRLQEMRDILIGNGERVAKVGKMPARLGEAELYLTMIADSWLGRSTITLGAIRLALGQLPGQMLKNVPFECTILEEVPAQFDGEPTYILPESHVKVAHAPVTFRALTTKLHKA